MSAFFIPKNAVWLSSCISVYTINKKDKHKGKREGHVSAKYQPI
jgi:hypothetical protein